MRRMFRSALLAAALAVPLAFAPAALAAGKTKGAPNDEAARRISAAESYIPQFGLSATVSANYSRAGMIMVDAGLDVPDAALRARLSKSGPRVRDALRSAIAEYANTHFRPGGSPDPDTIARMMQIAIDREVGQPGAKVLLANVIVQR
jgi:flagellar basal body-associated protein FliL